MARAATGPEKHKAEELLMEVEALGVNPLVAAMAELKLAVGADGTPSPKNEVTLSWMHDMLREYGMREVSTALAAVMVDEHYVKHRTDAYLEDEEGTLRGAHRVLQDSLSKEEISQLQSLSSEVLRQSTALQAKAERSHLKVEDLADKCEVLQSQSEGIRTVVSQLGGWRTALFSNGDKINYDVDLTVWPEDERIEMLATMKEQLELDLGMEKQASKDMRRAQAKLRGGLAHLSDASVSVHAAVERARDTIGLGDDDDASDNDDASERTGLDAQAKALIKDAGRLDRVLGAIGNERREFAAAQAKAAAELAEALQAAAAAEAVEGMLSQEQKAALEATMKAREEELQQQLAVMVQREKDLDEQQSSAMLNNLTGLADLERLQKLLGPRLDPKHKIALEQAKGAVKEKLERINAHLEQLLQERAANLLKIMEGCKWVRRVPQVVFNGVAYSSIVEWAKEREKIVKEAGKKHHVAAGNGFELVGQSVAGSASALASLPAHMRGTILDKLPPLKVNSSSDETAGAGGAADFTPAGFHGLAAATQTLGGDRTTGDGAGAGILKFCHGQEEERGLAGAWGRHPQLKYPYSDQDDRPGKQQTAAGFVAGGMQGPQAHKGGPPPQETFKWRSGGLNQQKASRVEGSAAAMGQASFELGAGLQARTGSAPGMDNTWSALPGGRPVKQTWYASAARGSGAAAAAAAKSMETSQAPAPQAPAPKFGIMASQSTPALLADLAGIGANPLTFAGPAESARQLGVGIGMAATTDVPESRMPQWKARRIGERR